MDSSILFGFASGVVVTILLWSVYCGCTEPTPPRVEKLTRPGITPTPKPAPLKAHDYCGICDPCQKTYIEQKMQVVQKEIEARDKRTFEQSVAKELAEIRKKEGLDIPLAQSNPAAYWEAEYSKVTDKLKRAEDYAKEMRRSRY